MARMKAYHTGKFEIDPHGQTYFKLTIDSKYRDFVSRLACVDHLVDLGPKNCFVFIDQRVIDVTEAFAEIMAEIASEVDRVELSDQWEK